VQGKQQRLCQEALVLAEWVRPDRGARRPRQDTVIHETQTMVEQRHPNLLPLLCCFVHGKQLWMVMPYMAGGSLLSIMQSNFPEAWARSRRRAGGGHARPASAGLLWHRGPLAVTYGGPVLGPNRTLVVPERLSMPARGHATGLQQGLEEELVAVAVMHGWSVLGANPTLDI
jgi:hypothetical protein